MIRDPGPYPRSGDADVSPSASSASYCTKLHQRLLSPALDSLDAALRALLRASVHRVDRALVDLNAGFDRVAELSGLRTAA